MILGVLTAKENPPAALTPLAQSCYKKGIQTVCFRPSDIQPVTHLVNGRKWNEKDKSWTIAKNLPLPYVLYDQCLNAAPKKIAQNEPIIQWLQAQKHIRFLNRSLPPFIQVYRLLCRLPAFRSYLLPAAACTQAADIIQALHAQKEILLDPTAFDCIGQIHLAQNNGQPQLWIRKKKKTEEICFSSVQELEDFLTKKIRLNAYILRPPIPFHTKQGEPFLIRTYMQKKGEIWKCIGQAVLIHPSHWIQAAQYAEERTLPLHDFLNQNAIRRMPLLQGLMQIHHQFPPQIEKAFGEQLELTLDFTCSLRGKLFLLNWNAKPSLHTKKIFQKHFDTDPFEATAEYAQLLLQTAEGI